MSGIKVIATTTSNIIPMSEMADQDDFEEIPDSEKTPVTIVTGFLGSGKTTLGKV